MQRFCLCNFCGSSEIAAPYQASWKLRVQLIKNVMESPTKMPGTNRKGDSPLDPQSSYSGCKLG